MSRPKLIFVDDEPAILATLSAILNQHGFDVTTAASVPEALDLIGKNLYDVLIADLNIGEPGDGFTVVSAMRRLQPQAATFIQTGYPDFDSALLAIRNQVDDYFTKPTDVKLLVDTITRRLKGMPAPRLSARLRRVSDVLRENTTCICQSWLEEVNRNPDLSRVQLTPEERAGYMPELVQGLIERVEREPKGTSQTAVTAAAKHGRARCRQGYTIVQMVLESRLLQHAVTSTVQANLLGLEMSNLICDLVEVGEALASLLEISVRAYQADFEESAAALAPV